MNEDRARLLEREETLLREDLERNEAPGVVPSQWGPVRSSIRATFFLGLLLGAFLTNVFFSSHVRALLTGGKPFTESDSKTADPIAVHQVPNTSSTHFDCFITVYSYDRPRNLLNLLQDIVRETKNADMKIGVMVIEDNSFGCIFPSVNENIFDIRRQGSTDMHLVHVNDSEVSSYCSARPRFKHVEKLIHDNNWQLYISKYRHGLKRHWHLVRMAHTLLRSVSAEKFIFLPDDNRLARDFFKNVIHHWNIIQDPLKYTMMFHIEESREKGAFWTEYETKSIGNGIFQIGWVEAGNFICTKQFLELMQWAFPRLPLKRWAYNATLSSGIGLTFSKKIYSAGKHMYRTEKSFVAHIAAASSKMRTEVNTKDNSMFRTKYFADGDDAYKQLLSKEYTATASIASSWTRQTSLHPAINSLGPQVDHINVYLNNYDRIPPYLMAPHITVKSVKLEANLKDVGDVGKFYWSNEIDTEFHLTADDDIIYAEDYVSSLVSFCRKYKAPAAVGVHGVRMRPADLTPADGGEGKGYYNSRDVWHLFARVKDPVPVHIIGTGTLLYRPQDFGHINVSAVFPIRNMADIWFGLLAQRLKIPMITIPHTNDWLRPIRGNEEESIFMDNRLSDWNQTQAVKSITWKINQPEMAANR